MRREKVEVVAGRGPTRTKKERSVDKRCAWVGVRREAMGKGRRLIGRGKREGTRGDQYRRGD